MAAVEREYPHHVAVVGAGMAGMACAATLVDAGIAVRVFEKSRGTGGRLAARPVGGTNIDIGAQYATARGPAFRAIVDRLIDSGSAAPWQPRIRDIRLDGDDVVERQDSWIVGVPGMDALAESLSQTVSISFGTRVAGVSHSSEGWFLRTADDGSAGPFSAVAVTAPAPQTAALMADHDPAFEAIAEVGMSPCWTLACVFQRPVEFDADVVRPGRGTLTWSARNGAKPGRDSDSSAWVIHGDPVWSLDRIDADPDAVSRALLEAFAAATGADLPPVVATRTHRWRFARVERPLGQSHLLGCDGTLGAAGDWCIGARVEAAFDSGRSLGRALAEQLRAPHPEID